MRLTPEVFRKKSGEWVVKNEFDKLDDKNLKDNIEYIFNTTVDIILSVHVSKKNIKSQNYKFFKLELVEDEIEVYKKADKSSEIIGKTPKGQLELDCVYNTEGLNGDGTYWKIRHMSDSQYLFGYILEDYVK